MIDKDTDTVDDSLRIKDFAEVISYILSEDYGYHNYKEFLNILRKNGIR